MHLIVVTGLSGAGKSTALTALADVGYECVDNLPAVMLRDLLGVMQARRTERVAVGIDARDRAHLERFPAIRDELQAEGQQVEVLYLDASNEELVRRFSETRRMHPLGRIPEALDKERQLLAPLRSQATTVIDTSSLRGRQLRTLIRERHGSAGALTVSLMSFGFKNGIPVEADLIFDVRFLQNPYDVPDLRPLSGFDEPVRDFVLGQQDATAVANRIEDWVRFQIPRSMREGRSYLTVAIGCTGGQHRSVALVRELERRLTQGSPLSDPPAVLGARHRDVTRGEGTHA